jgi:ketosteroid isomerase-like protein
LRRSFSKLIGSLPAQSRKGSDVDRGGLMRAMVVLLVSSGLSLSLSAQESSPRQEILAASHAWWDAFLRGDADRMAAIETEDVVIINNGIVSGKSRLAGLRGRAPIERTQSIDVQHFEVYGPVATRSGFIDITAPTPPSRGAFSEVWVRQGTAWRIKSVHFSRAMPVESPSAAPQRFRPVTDMDPDLRDALRRRDEAIKARDAEAWGRLVTNDHLNITANGFRETRSDRMTNLRRPNPVAFLEDKNPGFRSYGSNLVIYDYTTGVPSGAQTIVGEVWIKSQAGWQLAHRQATWK